MQAAIGGAQLARLDAFVAARRRNFATLRAGLVDLDDRLLPPAWHAKAKPSWFGYPVVVREDAGFGRDALVRFLEERGIGTRPMFAGNVQRHPAYAGAQMRVAGRLDGADALTERGFWVGVFPGITEVMAQYVVTAFHDFVHAEKH